MAEGHFVPLHLLTTRLFPVAIQCSQTDLSYYIKNMVYTYAMLAERNLVADL